VKVQTLTPNIASQLNLPPGTFGVVVTTVDPSSPAAGYLQRGDVIQEVNRKRVANVTQYDEAVAAAGTNSVLLLVNRGGQTIYVPISASGGGQ
jgi:serine protease Do